MSERARMDISLPEGFRIGHWADPEAQTGCTVILCPEQTAGGCDIRGNSPGSRELALLDSTRTMAEVHALLLTGGSAFGLAAADGVMRFLEERGVGYVTPWARVPIVPAAVIYDLNVGSAKVRPTPASGYAACENAVSSVGSGRTGAGTGALVGKWQGMEHSMRGGFGVASNRIGDVHVVAIAVVNAVGDIIDADGSIIAGARGVKEPWAAAEQRAGLRMPLDPSPTNTTLVALLTDAQLSKVDANRMAMRGHDGMARAVKPVHTSHDGDVVFTLASGVHAGPFDSIAEMGAELTAAAIRNAVRATP
jgi:L-aminopeptidase/D-esterase-like protein